MSKIDEKRIKPVANRVVIRPDQKETKTSGGLIKPDSTINAELQLTGTVIAVGDGKPGEPMMVKVDDSVLFGKNDGTVIGDGLIIMEEHRILCVL